MEKSAKIFKELKKKAEAGNLNMALSQLDKVKDYAGLLHNALHERHAEGHILIPAWVASKITKAEDYLNSSYDYMSANNYKYAYAKDSFKPHMMYHGKKSKMANTYEEHLSLKNKGWGHTKTANHLFFKGANAAKVQALMAKGMSKAQATKAAYPQGQPSPGQIGTHAAAPPLPLKMAS